MLLHSYSNSDDNVYSTYIRCERSRFRDTWTISSSLPLQWVGVRPRTKLDRHRHRFPACDIQKRKMGAYALYLGYVGRIKIAGDADDAGLSRATEPKIENQEIQETSRAKRSLKTQQAHPPKMQAYAVIVCRRLKLRRHEPGTNLTARPFEALAVRPL